MLSYKNVPTIYAEIGCAKIPVSSPENLHSQFYARYPAALLQLLSAYILQTAFITVRFRARRAHLPAVPDQPVTEIAAFLWRYDLPQCHLHFLWFFDVIHQPDPVTQTDAVRVRDDCRLSEYISHNKIRTLAPHPRQF